MNDPCRPFRQMARNAQLANRRLAQACLALAPGEWEAPRVSFFPSLKATLNHLLVVDRFYLDAIAGGSLGPDAWADPEPCATAADWAEAQAEMDRQLVVLAETLVAQDLLNIVQIRRTGRVQIETLGDTLLHLMLHDQHHRGQAHAMLSGSSVAPPQLDEFIVSDDAQYRRDDLAALGRDEDWLRR